MIESRLSESKRICEKTVLITVNRTRRTRGNVDWVARAARAAKLSADKPRLLLLGGAGLADFRVRVAQSSVRADNKPSYWSHVGVLMPGARATVWQVTHEMPFRRWKSTSKTQLNYHNVPERNGVHRVSLSEFDDARRYPNIAMFEVPGPTRGGVLEAVERLRIARASEDMVTDIVHWLGYIWGARGFSNPLLAERPLPAASFVRAVFGSAGIDLSPGHTPYHSCPESIWHAMLWWTDFYHDDDDDHDTCGIRGAVVLGQREAYVVDE